MPFVESYHTFCDIITNKKSQDLLLLLLLVKSSLSGDVTIGTCSGNYLNLSKEILNAFIAVQISE